MSMKLSLEVLGLDEQEAGGLQASESMVSVDMSVTSMQPRGNPHINYNTGELIEPTVFPFKIGRHPDKNQLVVSHDKVSREHGVIQKLPDGSFQYLDTSTYGTLIDGKDVHELTAVPLVDGAIMVFTAVKQWVACRLRVHIEQVTDVLDDKTAELPLSNRPTTVE